MRKSLILAVALWLCIAALVSAQAADLHLPFGIPFDTGYESLIPLFEEKNGVRLVAPEDEANRLETPNGVFLAWEGIPAYMSFTFLEDGSSIGEANVHLYRDALPVILRRDEAAATENLRQQLDRLSTLFDGLDSRLGPADAATMYLGNILTLQESDSVFYQLPVKGGRMDTESVRAAFLEHSHGGIQKLYSNMLISVFFAKQPSFMGFVVNIAYQPSLPSQEEWNQMLETGTALPQYNPSEAP